MAFVGGMSPNPADPSQSIASTQVQVSSLRRMGDRLPVAKLVIGRVNPAVTFDEPNKKMIVYGGTSVDGQLLNSVEII